MRAAIDIAVTSGIPAARAAAVSAPRALPRPREHAGRHPRVDRRVAAGPAAAACGGGAAGSDDGGSHGPAGLGSRGRRLSAAL